MKKIIQPIIVVLCVIFFVYIVPWFIISNNFSIFSGKKMPAPPAKTYGEFPFEITYRIGEETVEIKDTYICEFQKVKYNKASGYYYEWDAYIKGSGKEEIYITEDDKQIVYCSVGDPEYYIYHNDYVGADPYKPRFYAVSKNPESDSMPSDEVVKHFDLEIISFELSEPIQ